MINPESLPQNDLSLQLNSLSQSDILTGQKEIVFLDSHLNNIEEIVDSLSSNPNLEINILSAETDGIEQITDVLNNYQEISAVHIFSHGNEGTLQLGSTTLNGENLVDYQDELTNWGNSFRQILTY